MKNRLLVMNGQRIVQAERDGVWVNEKVEKAGVIKPGIYNLHSASAAGKTERHEGVIVHTNKESIYQQVGRSMIMHESINFDKVPEIGVRVRIEYDQRGKAQVSEAVLSRSRSR